MKLLNIREQNAYPDLNLPMCKCTDLVHHKMKHYLDVIEHVTAGANGGSTISRILMLAA